MTLFDKTVFATLTGLLCCSSTLAQVRYCIGGDLDHMSGSQRAACTAKMQVVRAAATELQAPDNWHFVVVCGEQGWQDYVTYAAASGNALQGADASTNLEEHETFFRGVGLEARDEPSVRRLVGAEIVRITRAQDRLAANQPADGTFHRTPHAGGL